MKQFGKMLSRIRFAREQSKMQAIDELWARNGVGASERDLYIVKEAATTYPDGSQVMEYKLYKLIDAAVVVLSTEVSTVTELGLSKLKENQYQDGSKAEVEDQE